MSDAGELSYSCSLVCRQSLGGNTRRYRIVTGRHRCGPIISNVKVYNYASEQVAEGINVFTVDFGRSYHLRCNFCNLCRFFSAFSHPILRVAYLFIVLTYTSVSVFLKHYIQPIEVSIFRGAVRPKKSFRSAFQTGQLLRLDCCRRLSSDKRHFGEY